MLYTGLVKLEMSKNLEDKLPPSPTPSFSYILPDRNPLMPQQQSKMGNKVFIRAIMHNMWVRWQGHLQYSVVFSAESLDCVCRWRSVLPIWSQPQQQPGNLTICIATHVSSEPQHIIHVDTPSPNHHPSETGRHYSSCNYLVVLSFWCLFAWCFVFFLFVSFFLFSFFLFVPHKYSVFSLNDRLLVWNVTCWYKG